MSTSNRGDRSALVVLAFLVGSIVLVSILGLWSRQAFDQPTGQPDTTSAEAYQGQRGPAEGYWWPEFSTRDTYAQWATSVLALVATALSIVGVVLLRKTFDETEKTARAAIRANEIAQDNATRQLRAYIGTAEIAITNLVVGKAPKIVVKWTNRGQTPAKILRAFASTKATVDPENEKFVFDDTGGMSKGVVGAGGFVTHEILARSAITEDMIAPMMDGTHKLVIGGYMIYEDVFGVTRRTIVRAMLNRESITNGTAGIHYCGRNNKAS